MIGGWATQPITTVEAYLALARTWQHVPGLPVARADLAATMVPGGQVYAIGGLAGDGTPLGTVEVYGPTFSVTPAAARPGATVVVTGTNFGSRSTVRLYWNVVATGTLLAVGTITRAGDFSQPLTFTVPAGLAPGVYHVTAEDDQAVFPVTAPFTVLAMPEVDGRRAWCCLTT